MAARLIARLPDLSGPKLPALGRANWKTRQGRHQHSGPGGRGTPVQSAFDVVVSEPSRQQFGEPTQKGRSNGILVCLERHQLKPCPRTGSLLARSGWPVLLKAMCLLLSACAGTCAWTPRMAGDSSFDRFCASRAPGSGRAGFQAWTTGRKTLCASRGGNSAMAGCCWLPQIFPRLKMRSVLIARDGGIECLFADAETRGFNIGDTRITGHRETGSFACGRCIGHGVGAPMRKPCKWAERPFGKKAARGAGNPGSGSGSAHCGAGCCMIPKKPWRLGDEHVQSAPPRSKSQAGFRYESCTVIPDITIQTCYVPASGDAIRRNIACRKTGSSQHWEPREY